MAAVFSLVITGIAGYRNSGSEAVFLGLQRVLQPVSPEQVPVVLEERDELARDRLGQRVAGEHRERRAAGELRREREEQLVDQPLAYERLVQSRPALAQDRPHAVFGTQALEQRPQ